MKQIVVAISGASGVIYGCKLVEELAKRPEVALSLIVTPPAKKLIEMETDRSVHSIEALATNTYQTDDLGAPIASGSVRTDGMAIVPTSMSTVSKLAYGIADNLLTRTAAVCLKEHRPLVVVPRETPLSVVHLDAMRTLATSGACILPAMPGFYHRPASIGDLVAFIVGKVLDALGIENECFARWDGVR